MKKKIKIDIRNNIYTNSDGVAFPCDSVIEIIDNLLVELELEPMKVVSEIMELRKNNMFSLSEFSIQNGLSRQRIHILVKQNRIIPEPVKFGNDYYFSFQAKILPSKFKGRPKKK